jgi:hypothetical protein
VLDLTQDSPVKRAAPVTETERHPVHSALGANFRVMELPEHEENAIPNLSLSPTNKCVVCNTSLAGLNLDVCSVWRCFDQRLLTANYDRSVKVTLTIVWMLLVRCPSVTLQARYVRVRVLTSSQPFRPR